MVCHRITGLPVLISWCIALTLALLLGIEPLLAKEATIRFAPLPMENREAIVLKFRPMVAYLEEQLGPKIEFDFSENYAKILEKFKSGKIDLAYLGPLPYVELRAQYAQAEPLIHFKEASGQPKYTCSIIALADQPIELKNLENHNIALTQPLSTCGYLSVNGLLRQHNSSCEKNHYRYLGKHDAVALAVIRGEYQLGGIKTAIGQRYAHMGLRILAQTPPFPGFALIGNTATLSPKTLEAIQQAMITLDPTTKGKEEMSRWGRSIRYGAVQADDADYETVRAYKGELTIPTTNKEAP